MVWRLMGKIGEETSEKFPAVVSGAKPVINLGVAAPSAWPDFAGVSVDAVICRPENSSAEPLLASIQWDVTLKYFQCVLKSARPLPWSFVGTVTWTFTNTSSRKVLGTETTDLELYVLSTHLPDFMLKEGVPLELLRMPTLLPYWMMKDFSAPSWSTNFKTRIDRWLQLGTYHLPATWGPFVALTLSREKRFHYDPREGSASYFQKTSNPDQYALWMDLWLSDLNGIERRNNPGTEKYAVNCEDLAYLVQVIASLGLPDSTALTVMKIDKFGTIDPTRLIGNSSTATNFNYHFVVVQGVVPASSSTQFVLDACYGPELGTTTFQSYVTARANSNNKEERLLDRFVKRVYFARDVRLASSDLHFTNLYSLMQSVFTTNLLPPFQAVISFANKPGFESTWTYREYNKEAHINIIRYAQDTDLNNEFKARKNNRLNIDGLHFDFPGSANNLMQSRKGYPLYLMYAYSNVNDGNYLLVVIEGTLDIEAATTATTGLFPKLDGQVLKKLPKLVVNTTFITGHELSLVTTPSQKILYPYCPIHVTLTVSFSTVLSRDNVRSHD